MQPTVSKHWEKLNDLNQEVYLLAASHVQLWPVVIDVLWFVSVSVSPTKKATPVYMPLGMWLGLAKDTTFYVGPRFPNGMGTSVGQPPVMWPFVKIFDTCYLIALLLIFYVCFSINSIPCRVSATSSKGSRCLSDFLILLLYFLARVVPHIVH